MLSTVKFDGQDYKLLEQSIQVPVTPEAARNISGLHPSTKTITIIGCRPKDRFALFQTSDPDPKKAVSRISYRHLDEIPDELET